MKKTPSYKRILLKLSGELLLGGQPFGIDFTACHNVAKGIKKMHAEGIEIGIVIGAGNLFRAINLKESGLQRTSADQMGMLGTILNGIALQQSLEGEGCPAKLFSALEVPRVADTYNWNKALESLQAGQVVIFVGGTGNPYFTTDTAAALRASEIKADVLLKATKVDGIYDKDPAKHADAKRYQEISYTQFLAQKLEVMDSTAVALCMSNHIPVLVYDMQLLMQGKGMEILKRPELGTILKGD